MSAGLNPAEDSFMGLLGLAALDLRCLNITASNPDTVACGAAERFAPALLLFFKSCGFLRVVLMLRMLAFGLILNATHSGKI